MSELKTYEILSGETKKTQRGEYLSLLFQGKEKTYKRSCFVPEVAKAFAGPGQYEVGLTKDGDFYNVTSLRKVSGEVTRLGANGSQVVTRTLDPNGKYRDKSISAQVAVKAAADVVVAMLSHPHPALVFKNRDDVSDTVVFLARLLAKEIESAVEPKPVEIKSRLQEDIEKAVNEAGLKPDFVEDADPLGV